MKRRIADIVNAVDKQMAPIKCKNNIIIELHRGKMNLKEAMVVAIFYRSFPAVKYLIKKEAPVDVLNFIESLKTSNIDIVKIIHKKVAHLPETKTVMNDFLGYVKADIFQYLMMNGADPSKKLIGLMTQFIKTEDLYKFGYIMTHCRDRAEMIKWALTKMKPDMIKKFALMAIKTLSTDDASLYISDINIDPIDCLKQAIIRNSPDLVCKIVDMYEEARNEVNYIAARYSNVSIIKLMVSRGICTGADRAYEWALMKNDANVLALFK